MNAVNLSSEIETVSRLLIAKKLTIAFAESATAGSAAASFSLACDAGKFLKGGVVCYDARLKCDLLGVPDNMLKEYTPESMEVTRAIAHGLAKLIEADIHIGITGLPCSGGSETTEKPVGTMFVVAVRQGEELFAVRKQFSGTHTDILQQTSQYLAAALLKIIGDP